MSWEDTEKRIASVFGTDKGPEVTSETLVTYRNYLSEHLRPGVRLTGREDFQWEERYVLGYGDPNEYEKLKKTRASYTDQLELLEIIPEDEPECDLTARVRRSSDSRVFEIGLSWLTTTDEESPEFQFLDDFSTWVANYQ